MLCLWVKPKSEKSTFLGNGKKSCVGKAALVRSAARNAFFLPNASGPLAVETGRVIVCCRVGDLSEVGIYEP